MSKHTQGPWSWENYNGLIHVFLENEFGTPSVCKVIGKNQEANARLIAAAPDLLAELRECRDLLMCAETCSRNNFNNLAAERVDEINALIAKAEGGAA